MRLAQTAADAAETSPQAPFNILSEAYEGLTVKVLLSFIDDVADT